MDIERITRTIHPLYETAMDLCTPGSFRLRSGGSDADSPRRKRTGRKESDESIEMERQVGGCGEKTRLQT